MEGLRNMEGRMTDKAGWEDSMDEFEEIEL